MSELDRSTCPEKVNSYVDSDVYARLLDLVLQLTNAAGGVVNTIPAGLGNIVIALNTIAGTLAALVIDPINFWAYLNPTLTRLGIRTATPTSVLDVLGSFALSAIRADNQAVSTFAINDFCINKTPPLAGSADNLPQAAGCAGRFYLLRKADAGVDVAVFTPFAGDDIDGAVKITLTTQYDFALVYSLGGTRWQLVLSRIAGVYV